MNKIFIISLLFIASLSAREYNDPSKKKKNALLEEGQTPPVQTEVVAAPAASPAASTASDAGKAQYCACFNLLKLVTKKDEITRDLIYKEVVEDSDWAVRRKLTSDIDAVKAAVNKAAYNNEIDKAEVECDVLVMNYKKVSAMKSDIEREMKACNLAEI